LTERFGQYRLRSILQGNRPQGLPGSRHRTAASAIIRKKQCYFSGLEYFLGSESRTQAERIPWTILKQAERMVASRPIPLTVVEADDSSKRRQILDGARAVFMDLGFDGASMGEIARAAGVSKGTLYVYFADKNRLFEAIVEQECLEQGHVAFNFDPSRGPQTMLPEFGRAFIRVLCRPEGGSSLRTVMAIAERMPEVGRRFYEEVIAMTIGRLAAYLDSQCADGTLKIEDTTLAASQFMEMCKATLFLPYIFQAAPAPAPEQIADAVDSATRVFLAAYGVKQN
jgi:AcrR family transcriptional regulator